MAREAGFDVVVQINAVDGSIAHLTAFAALVRADEREQALAAQQEPVKFNEELHQERERRQQLETELMRMQGRELKLQMALNTPAAQRQWDYDTLHAAWHAVGADVAGLNWDTFVAKLKEKNT